jgi:transcriptional regulator with XRE-family HTH domain
MEMKINIDVLKREREARNWTQQQLAEICSLSLRTIQRIEKDGSVSKESLASLSSAFELDYNLLLLADESTHPTISKNDAYELRARLLRSLKSIYSHSVVTFSIIIFIIGIVGLVNSNLDSRIWFLIGLIFSSGVLLTVSVMRYSNTTDKNSD